MVIKTFLTFYERMVNTMNNTRLYEVFKNNYFYDHENLDVDNIDYEDENYDIYLEARDNLLKDIYEMIIDHMLENLGDYDTISKDTKVLSDWEKYLVKGSLLDEIVNTEDWENIKNRCIKAIKEADVGDCLCELLVDVISESFDF